MPDLLRGNDELDATRVRGIAAAVARQDQQTDRD